MNLECLEKLQNQAPHIKQGKTLHKNKEKFNITMFAYY